MFDARPAPVRRRSVAWRLPQAAATLIGLASAGAAVALSIEIFGSPHDATPRETILLFSPSPAQKPALRDRLVDAPAPSDAQARLPVPDLASAPTEETPMEAPALQPGYGVSISVDPSLDRDAGPSKPRELSMISPDALQAPANADAPARRYAPSPLVRAPIAALTRQSPYGPLPTVAPDGRRPLQAYARPFTANGKPRIALVVGGLGLDPLATRAAIEELPPEVTLSFIPYAPDLQSWVNRARAQGHEVILELPMESFDARADTGPLVLSATGSREDNSRRLGQLLSRASGYFAVANYAGARLAAQGATLSDVIADLDQKGLALVHDGATARPAFELAARAAGLPFVAFDRIIDQQRRPDAIDAQLLALETLALKTGSALGGANGVADTIAQTAAWAETLTLKGYQLAPASAVLRERSAAP